MPPPPVKHRKLAIIGGRGVGKSSLTTRFVNGYFVESYYPTIQNTFNKNVMYKGQEYATELVDLAGQDEYSLLNHMSLATVHGFMIVYSVASRQSFELAGMVRKKILANGGEVPLVLVGNKSDVPQDQRRVTPEEGKALAQDFGCPWIETSARLNTKVAESFHMLLDEIEKHMGASFVQPESSKCLLM